MLARTTSIVTEVNDALAEAYEAYGSLLDDKSSAPSGAVVGELLLRADSVTTKDTKRAADLIRDVRADCS